MRRKEKIRETNFEQKERPRTRLAQYFDVFKHNFVELLKISLLQTVFNMPLIATMVTFWLFIGYAAPYGLGASMTVFLITAGALLLSMMSSFTGMTGSFYCLKKICFAEGEYASSSFFIGLRDEWKKGLLTGFIVGLSAAVALIGFFFSYFYLSQVNVTISGLGIAIVIIQFMVVLMIAYYTISQVIVYDNKYRYVLKNSFIMTLMRFHINLLLFIIHPGIIIALAVIMDITMYVSLPIIVLFIVFFHLIWVCNTLGAFDKFINKENHPEIYMKGLYKEG